MIDWVCEHWAMVPGVVFLFAAAWCQWRLNRVPNVLCFEFLMWALTVATASTLGFLRLPGGLGSSVLGLALAFLLLLPLYACGSWGAGCVKAQAVFGAWLGCALPVTVIGKAVLITTELGAIVTLTSACLTLRWLSLEEGECYEFPAQVTLSLGSLIGFCLFLNI